MIKRTLSGERVTGMLDIRDAKVIVIIRNGEVTVTAYDEEVRK